MLSSVRTSANAVWLIACRIGADLLSFGLFVCVARALGPAGTGLYAYAFAIATLGYVVASLGIEAYGVREYTRLMPAERGELIGSLLGAQGLITALSIPVFVVFLLVTGASASTVGVIACLATYQFAWAFARTLFIPANAEQEMSGPALIELGCRTAAIATAIVLLMVLHSSLRTALMGFPVAATLLLFASAGSARRRIGLLTIHSRWIQLARSLQNLWVFAASEVCVHLFARVSIIALTIIVGETAAGLYAAGAKFIELACMPLVLLGLAAYPGLSSSFRADRAAFERSATQLLWVTAFLAGLAAWGIRFVVAPLAPALLGNQFVAAVPVLENMVALLLVQAAEVVLVRLLLAADLQGPRLGIIVLGTVGNVILTVVLTRHLQVSGAILASTLALALTAAGYAWALKQRLTLPILAAPSIALLAGVSAAVGIYELLHAEQPLELTAAGCLIGFMLAFGLVYALAAHRRSRPDHLRLCIMLDSPHFHAPFNAGGSVKQLRALAGKLRQRGVEISFVSRKSATDLRATDVVDGMSIRYLGPAGEQRGKGWRALLPNILFMLNAFLYLVRIRGTYDIVLVSGFRLLAVPAGIAARIDRKVCVTRIEDSHDLGFALTEQSAARIGRLGRGVMAGLIRLLYWLAFRTTHAVVAFSSEIAARLEQMGAPTNKIARIPNGIDSRLFAPLQEAAKRELRRELGLPLEKIIFIFTGRISRSKGVPQLLAMWQRLWAIRTDVHLVLLGSDAESYDGCAEEMRAFIELHGLDSCITRPGNVPNVPQYLQAADAFIFLSLRENFSLSILEALAAGLPSVLTRVGGAPEPLPGAGWGQLVEVSAPVDTVLESVRKLLSARDEWHRMGETARTIVAENYTMDTVAAQYCKLFSSLSPIDVSAK